MRFFHIGAVWASVALGAFAVMFAGCSAEQLAWWDQTVADVNQVGQGVAAVAQGPAGEKIPPPWRGIMELVGLATGGIALSWQEIRRRKLLEQEQALTTTARAIVRGVENASPEVALPAKASIGQAMKDAGCYDAGRAVVNSLKSP